jgi:hypothetical protein
MGFAFVRVINPCPAPAIFKGSGLAQCGVHSQEEEGIVCVKLS